MMKDVLLGLVMVLPAMCLTAFFAFIAYLEHKYPVQQEKEDEE
jgi:hypothetical protein